MTSNGRGLRVHLAERRVGQSFAQALPGDQDVPGTHPLDQADDGHRTGHDRVRPVFRQAEHRRALAARERSQLGFDLLQRLARDLVAVQARARRLLLEPLDLREVSNRAAGSHQARARPKRLERKLLEKSVDV